MSSAPSVRIRVLLAINEPYIAGSASRALRNANDGWMVAIACDGESTITQVGTFLPDVVVLDSEFADMHGHDVLRKVRQLRPEVPLLLVLPERRSLEERVEGFMTCGDDYLTKPFSIEDLIVNIRALVRSSGLLPPQGAKLVVGDLVLDEDSHEVTRGGDALSLTAMEFQLLRFMMLNTRCVLAKNQILDRVWNYEYRGRSNIVELYISYLRRKIDAGRTPMIHTVRGSGYILRPPS